WIETSLLTVNCPPEEAVAPHAGAWIETWKASFGRCPELSSRPTRARGLKQLHFTAAVIDVLVAPHAGAWIETDNLLETAAPGVSRPTRARGLKPLYVVGANTGRVVAPHAGAWIETRLAKRSRRRGIVAPHAGAWIETFSSPLCPTSCG